MYKLPTGGLYTEDGEEVRGREPNLCGARVDNPLDIWTSYAWKSFAVERKPVDIDGVGCECRRRSGEKLLKERECW